MKSVTCALLFFLITCSLQAQDSAYSILVIEKSTYVLDAKKQLMSDYKIIHYDGSDTTHLTPGSGNSAVNQIVTVFNNLKNEGWQIVSVSDDFYHSETIDLDDIPREHGVNISSKEYLLLKER